MCRPFEIYGALCVKEPYPPHDPVRQAKLMDGIATICWRRGIELPRRNEGYSEADDLVEFYFMVGLKFIFTEEVITNLGGWQQVEDITFLPKEFMSLTVPQPSKTKESVRWGIEVWVGEAYPTCRAKKSPSMMGGLLKLERPQHGAVMHNTP